MVRTMSTNRFDIIWQACQIRFFFISMDVQNLWLVTAIVTVCWIRDWKVNPFKGDVFVEETKKDVYERKLPIKK